MRRHPLHARRHRGRLRARLPGLPIPHIDWRGQPIQPEAPGREVNTPASPTPRSPAPGAPEIVAPAPSPKTAASHSSNRAKPSKAATQNFRANGARECTHASRAADGHRRRRCVALTSFVFVRGSPCATRTSPSPPAWRPCRWPVAAAATSRDIHAEPTFHRLPVAAAEPTTPTRPTLGWPRANPPRWACQPRCGRWTARAHRRDGAGRDRWYDGNSRRASGPAAAAVAGRRRRCRAVPPGLPALRSTAGLSPSPRRTGCRRAIYIVAAFHHPNAMADRAAQPASSACRRPVHDSRRRAARWPGARLHGDRGACRHQRTVRVAQAPGCNAGWATRSRSTCNGQHATAPLARIVVIEAADAAARR